MDVQPDHGGHSYRGTRRLEGKKAIITGGDSAIGRERATSADIEQLRLSSGEELAAAAIRQA